MPKLPRLTAKELIKILEEHGFVCVRQSGSHRIFKNSQNIRATVPFHAAKTIHPKIIKQIFRDIGLDD